MIAWVEGVLREKEPTRAVVDVQGVGYELLIPLSTFAELPDTGKTISLHVHTHVREEAIQLFGFVTRRERSVFELLLKANRVGPKLAQGILSGIDTGLLVAALRGGDVKALRGVPGVGPKMAERMIVELRDGAAELESFDDHSRARTSAHTRAGGEAADQAVSALVNLGYPRSQAEKVIEAAVSDVGEDAPIESVIRVALRGMAQ